MRVTVYGKNAEINEKNPAFDYMTGLKLPFVEVFAIVGNKEKVWRESFKVSDEKVAEVQIAETLKFFNDTLQPGEKPREFREMYKECIDVQQYEDGGGMSGWLKPDGIFMPCGFGEHKLYAKLFFEENEQRGIFEDVDVENQFIPMSREYQSANSYISFFGDITPLQVEWFNRFFYKLTNAQRSSVVTEAEKQNISLKYAW